MRKPARIRRWVVLAIRASLAFIALTLLAFFGGPPLRSALLQDIHFQNKEGQGRQATASEEPVSAWRSLEGPPGLLRDFHPIRDGDDTIIYGHSDHALFRFSVSAATRTDITGGPFASSAIRDVQVVPLADGTHKVFVLTDSALYVSTSRGDVWYKVLAPAELSPPHEPVLQSFSVAADGNGEVVAAASRQEIFWSQAGRVEVRGKAQTLGARHIGIMLLARGADIQCLLVDSEGLRRSRDRCRTWERVPELEGFAIKRTWKRYRNPGDELVYVEHVPKLYALRGNELWRSGDGLSWRKDETPAFFRYFDGWRGDDCAGSQREAKFRLNTDSSNHFRSALLSSDGGRHWQKMTLDGLDWPASIGFRCVAASGGVPDVMLLAGGDLIRLDLTQRLWSRDRMFLSAPVVGIRRIAVVPSDGTLLAATDTGLFLKKPLASWGRMDDQGSGVNTVGLRSTLEGRVVPVVGLTTGLYHWEDPDGWKQDRELGDQRVMAIALREGQVAWVGTEGGVFKRVGDKWRSVDAVAPGENLNAIAVLSREVVVLAGERGVYVSKDEGATFLRSDDMRTNVLALAAYEQDGRWVLVAGGSEGAYVSRDVGLTWKRVFPDGDSLVSVTSVLAVQRSDGPFVYLGTIGQGLVWSKDFVRWETDPEAPVRHVSTITARDPEVSSLIIGTFDRSVWELTAPPHTGPS